MKYLSVCSGIEAASVAWHPLGWEPVAFSEIEAFPSAVLAHRFPTVPNLGDMTRIHESEVFRAATIDLLVGGTPCQSFSVAGLRKGLDDPRGNLALHFLKLAATARPRWVVWENVPGVLSSWTGPEAPSDLQRGQEWQSEETSDFGCFLAGLGELGYGWAYRVLDAQYFGVAQRRRRVFVVGYLGDARRAAAVLFERASLSGHLAPRRKAGEKPTQSLTRSFGGGGPDAAHAQAGWLVADTLRANHRDDSDQPTVAHTLRAEGFDASEDGTGRGIPLVPAIARALTAHNQRFDGTVETLVFDPTQITHGENRSNPQPGDPCHTLPTHGHPPAIAFRHWASASDDGAPLEEIVPTLRAGDEAGPAALVSGVTLHGSDATASVASFTDVACALRAREPGRIENSSTAVVFKESAPVDLQNLSIGKEVAGTLDTTEPSRGGGQALLSRRGVRRLTPRECERLQGFPDDWTLIPGWRKSPPRSDIADTVLYLRAAGYGALEAEVLARLPDGPRYKAIGNSMAVPVMAWIGERIQLVDSL